MDINQNNTNGDNIVNFGMPKRQLTHQLKVELLALLPSKTKNIKFFSSNGDADSHQYANETRNFLLSQGYTNLDAIIPANYFPAQYGESVDDRGNYYEITIGLREV